MFLVNKFGDCIIEVNRVDILREYDEKTKEEADKIYNGIMNKIYNYGSTENARNAANKAVKDFVCDKKQICKIFVNDECFGNYEEEQCKIAFENIVNSLKNGDRFLDMREFDFPEGEENDT